MYYQFRIFVAVTVILVMQFDGPSAFAAGNDTNQESVIVTATRFETSIETAPVNVTVISEQDINKSAATNLSQALETLGGVYVKDLFTPTGSEASVDMGGFGASGISNTLILLNGRRLNDADLSGINLDAIPLNSVAKIEIIRGNASVLYGDNATSGAINIVTKSGFDDEAMKVQVDSGNYNTRGAQLLYSGTSNNFAALISANTMASDGYRDNNRSDKNNALADFSISANDSLYGLRIIASDEELELPGSLDETTYFDDPTASNPSIEFINEDRTTAELYFQREGYAAELGYRNRNQSSFLFGDISSELETISLTPRFTTSLQQHTLVSGIDLYKSQLKINSDFSAFASLNKNDTDRDSVAIYLSDTINLGQATALNLGVRRQQVELDINNSDVTNSIESSDSETELLSAWDLTLNHRFNNDIKGYIRRAEGMRFPALDEMWDFFSGTINVLKPQTSSHVEAGLNVKVASSHYISATIFHIDIENEIGYDAATFSNINFDDTNHMGVDINYQALLTSWWKFTAAANWRKATFREGPYEDNDIPEIPQARASLRQSIDLPAQQHLGIDIIYTGPRYFADDYSNQGKKLGGYTTFNLQYHKFIGSWFMKLRINNAGNKKAADYGVYVDSPFVPNPYFYYPLAERTVLLSFGATIN